MIVTNKTHITFLFKSKIISTSLVRTYEINLASITEKRKFKTYNNCTLLTNALLKPKEVWANIDSFTSSGWFPSYRKNQHLYPLDRQIETENLQNPYMSLQGLDPDGRYQLYLYSLISLKDHVDSLPEYVDEASSEQWRLLVTTLAVSCCVQVSRMWLGFVPLNLLYQLEEILISLNNELEGLLISTFDKSFSNSIVKNSLSIQAYISSAQDSIRLQSRIDRKKHDSNVDTSGVETDQWNNVREKTALHATVIRYMRSAKDGDILSSELLLRFPCSGWTQTQIIDLNRSPSNTIQNQLQLRVKTREHLLRHSEEILQDLIICIADVVSESYIAEARNGQASDQIISQLNCSDLLPCSSWIPMLHPRLSSTRALERFMNQITLQRSFELQIKSVVAIYEDSYRLWGINLNNGRLLKRKIFIKRSTDISTLVGFQLFISFSVEIIDAVFPIVKNFGDQTTKTFTFFLTNIVGRCIGFIIQGVIKGLRITLANKR